MNQEYEVKEAQPNQSTWHATYTRMKDGTWGVRIMGYEGSVDRNIHIDVHSKNGNVKSHWVRVQYKGEYRYGQPFALGIILPDRTKLF